MNAIAVFLLFVGMFLVLQGYYLQKAEKVCPPSKTEIKYIPMSLYEEQLSPSDTITNQFRSMFESANPWPLMRN